MYKQFQKKHPEWPPTAKGCQGRYVRLKQDVQTRGGTKYKKGDTFMITWTWRGMFNLSKIEENGTLNELRIIRGIHPASLELLPL
jgi:hypothetical protein